MFSFSHAQGACLCAPRHIQSNLAVLPQAVRHRLHQEIPESFGSLISLHAPACPRQPISAAQNKVRLAALTAEPDVLEETAHSQPGRFSESSSKATQVDKAVTPARSSRKRLPPFLSPEEAVLRVLEDDENPRGFSQPTQLLYPGKFEVSSFQPAALHQSSVGNAQREVLSPQSRPNGRGGGPRTWPQVKCLAGNRFSPDYRFSLAAQRSADRLPAQMRSHSTGSMALTLKPANPSTNQKPQPLNPTSLARHGRKWQGLGSQSEKRSGRSPRGAAKSTRLQGGEERA